MLLCNPTASAILTRLPRKPCAKSPSWPHSDFDLSPKTTEPRAVGICFSSVPGSLLLALLKHLTNEHLMEQAQQHGSKQRRQVQFTAGAGKGGIKKSSAAPLSVLRCPLPHVTNVQHSKAETMNVHLLPGMVGTCPHHCSHALQSLKQLMLAPTPLPRGPPSPSQVQAAFQNKPSSSSMRHAQTYLAR